MKRFLTLTCFGVALALGGVLSISTGAANAHGSKSIRVVINHQTRGCHAWSINGGAYGVSKWAPVHVGGSATFVDNDIMPHKLILTSGPAVKFIGKPSMSHIGASVKVVFPKAGTYRFTTKFGEDYMNMPMMKTTGEDNVLHLVVTVA
jgi:plastocyanin